MKCTCEARMAGECVCGAWDEPLERSDPDFDVLTVIEAAIYLRISRTALYDAIGRGEVPHQRIGRHIRLHRSALVRFLSGSCGAASKKGC